jgi:hypothetical protein
MLEERNQEKPCKEPLLKIQYLGLAELYSCEIHRTSGITTVTPKQHAHTNISQPFGKAIEQSSSLPRRTNIVSVQVCPVLF